MDPLTISRLHRCSNTALSIAELGTGLIPIRGELKINFWRSEAFRIAYFFQGGRAVTILIKPLQFLRVLESLFANRRLHLFRWECIHVRTSEKETFARLFFLEKTLDLFQKYKVSCDHFYTTTPLLLSEFKTSLKSRRVTVENGKLYLFE